MAAYTIPAFYDRAMNGDYIANDNGTPIATTNQVWSGPDWYNMLHCFFDTSNGHRICEIEGDGRCEWFDFTAAFERWDERMEEGDTLKDLQACILTMLINGMKFHPTYQLSARDSDWGVRMHIGIREFLADFFRGANLARAYAEGRWVVCSSHINDIYTDDSTDVLSNVTDPTYQGDFDFEGDFDPFFDDIITIASLERPEVEVIDVIDLTFDD